MEILVHFVLLSLGVHIVSGDASASSSVFEGDRVLNHQPSFAHSLPIQILVTGIVFTLALVLFLYLLFTAQYHWPLARLNYGLQLSGVCTLLIWLSTTLGVVLRHVHQRSQLWPYMLDYVAVDVPNRSWTDTQEAWWLIMESTTSGLAHITHIQLLTLLYPSTFATRLIFLLLGPLAIASSSMVFTAMNSDQEVQDLGDAVRNVCNAALSLLLAAALIVWGFFIHRDVAWRTDGGTGVFGTGAIILAILSSVSNFIQIFLSRRIHWLLSLTWAVVFWQSFLGWWWWVGSGEGVNEVQDMLERERRRRRRRAKRKSKKAQAAASGASMHRGMLRAFRRRLTQTPAALPNADNPSRPGDSVHAENPPPNLEIHSQTVSSHGSSEPTNALGRVWARFCNAHRDATTERVELRKVTSGWGLGSFGVSEVERRRAQQLEGERDRTSPDEGAAHEATDGRSVDLEVARSEGRLNAGESSKQRRTV